jgi:endonuclease/exonuclease/phosphatase family metal-dependent hydrolase
VTILRPRRTWLYHFILMINVMVSVLLLVSILASYISPAMAWAVALFGIAYPYILLLNILFVIYWLLLLDKALLLSLGTILLGFPQLSNQVRLNFWKDQPVASPTSFKLLSFNTRLFDLYQWTNRGDTRHRIFRLLQKEDPSILCIQEFYTSSTRKGLNNLDSLRHLLKAPFIHSVYTDTKNGTDHWGIATFSKYPMVRKGKIFFHEATNNLCIYADLKIGPDTVRVYNVHFQSNRFRKEDYEFLGKPNAHNSKWVASQNILNRLKTGSIKRSRQVDMVADHIEKSPYPVVICGDFNDPPSSYTYNRISSHLKDAFVETGMGLGNTYNGIIPLLRIDYILHSPRLTSAGFREINVNYSDHFPITCLLELNPQGAGFKKPVEIEPY